MSDIDLNLLVALDRLLSEASVAGAARRLGLSASAMSRTLARLREATGDPLLVRAGRQMVLTPHAEALREPARQAVLGEMAPEVRLQALFRDRFVGVVRAGHPLAAEPEISAAQYAALGHVAASRRGRPHGPVDTALAALSLERRIVAIVPGFPAALAVVRASDLATLLPASFCAGGPAGVHVFALPVATAPITISQMWHPRLDADPAHRWLRQVVLSVCRDAVPGADAGAVRTKVMDIS